MNSANWWRAVLSCLCPRPLPVDPRGFTLLEAAERGDAPTVQELLAHGTPPDEVRTPDRETALWLAANRGYKAVVEALLAAGADPSITDRSGASALTEAAAAGRAAIIQLMARTRAEAFRTQSAALGLRRAALNRHADAVRALLRGGVPPDARVRGHPPAIFAAAISDRACLAELLAAGADTNQRDRDGRTALHHAVMADNLYCVRLLLADGADPAAKDKAGRMPADEAKSESARQLLTIFGNDDDEDDDDDDDDDDDELPPSEMPVSASSTPSQSNRCAIF